MICKNCGAQLPDGSTFCTQCGSAVQPEQAQPQYTPVQPADAAANATPILILGILALALNSIPYAGWIGGLICGILCANKVKAYLAAGGVLAGKAKVGKILGLVGLILSIVMAVVWIIVIIVAIVTAAAAASTISQYSQYL